MGFNKSNLLYALYELMLKRQVLSEGAVDHVAIIQDGNRRYARQRHMSTSAGHNMGARTTEMVSDWCLELG
ncbi:MAG: undecaprenyl diphosphate synthase family protein, partial [Methanotrichaceae archaeon]|nr:undecaprenyl diphosphate synthase family protein [Methanotrichaceae archaeon]